MITSFILGRAGQLGNQIFQYAVLIGISEKHGYDVALLSDMPLGNVWDAKTGTNLFYSSSLEKCFDIPTPFLKSSQIRIDKIVSEETYHFDPSILDVPDGVGLWGFFESEKYFEHCKEAVRSRLKFKAEIVERSLIKLSPYRTSNPLVSVHVRRGQDRPDVQDHYPFLPVEYYREAMSLFPGCNFLFFTDDPDWCKTNFSDALVMEWDTSYARPDFIDLCMMSMCDHHIIANSTFSWWGAWLNPSETKKVVSPKLWFGPSKVDSNGKFLDIKDNIPAEWIRI